LLMRHRGKRSGNVIVEVSLMTPWILFLFVGVLDFGYYSYAAIATQNAARAAALRTSANTAAVNNVLACDAALIELKGLPNMAGVTACVASPASITNAQPVAASVTMLTNATTPMCADCASIAAATSAQAAITYETLPMVPIPGLLMGRLRLTRVAEMRIRE
jgi:Flp pilus assembly protein TadG